MIRKSRFVLSVLILFLISSRFVQAENHLKENKGSHESRLKMQEGTWTEADRKATFKKDEQPTKDGFPAGNGKQEQANTSLAGNATAPAPLSSLTLEETRLTMDKWIETQQIISRERKDWQQGREILLGRLELVKKEIATLEEKTEQAESSIDEAKSKRNELLAENDQLTATCVQLTDAVTGMEGQIRGIVRQLPVPIQTKLQPLYQRIPEHPDTTKVSIAERFQNVLGILNELNKSNNEIIVAYEVHNLADGKPSEVKTIYVGLAQAYYVSASGEAGIGRSMDDGWKWEHYKSVGNDVMTALEIIEGKHSPAFVSLPVKLQ